MARVQRGVESAEGPEFTLVRHQESRIGRFHVTVADYLGT
jgi:hypothetical protein